MRHPASRVLVLLFMALFIGLSGVTAPRAFADARSDAKAHYQAGMKAYNAADYRTAIKEFSSAQQLAPADLMNYNLALCYDKLGEAEPAIQYYKEYLAKVPNASNRTELEASVSRLEGALKSAAQKRADEQRAADEARKAEEARKADEAAKKKAPDTTGTGATGTTGTGAGTTATVAPEVGPQQPTGVGSTGTPGSGQAVSTGDAQLDRASAISIDEIRAQRMGMGTPGVGGAPAAGGAAVGAQGTGGQGAYGAQANAGGAGAQGTSPGAPPEAAAPEQPKKPTPVYKKWWFWVVVAISAVVVYQIATEGSSSPQTNTRAREAQVPGSGRAAAAPDGGFTLLRF